MRMLKKALGGIANVDVNCKSPRQERLQALLSLGDRRLAPAMVKMARGKADLRSVLSHSGLDLDFYIHRRRPFEEILPWDHIDNGMRREILVSHYVEAKRSLDSITGTTGTTASSRL